MAPVFKPLTPSVPAFASANVPYSERYADVYHAVQGALEQARFVFLQGNGLPERWAGLPRFTVCETGFGLGYNFLALWQAWRADPQRSQRLHMVSVEAHPFSREHMAELLVGRLEGEARELAQALVDNWPPLLPGMHRIDLDGGAVTLTLAFGYALDMVPRLTAHVDAFFLDGFSPDRNPQMWSAPLMKSLARLAAPGATAATWSSAGDVRRALASAGFSVRKVKGFGYKRVMTVARYEPVFVPRQASTPPPTFAQRHAVVIGAGIAGANAAHALARRGWRVTVVDGKPSAASETLTTEAAAEAGAHHGHLAAALTPLIARDDNPRARLSRAGALRALANWAPWMDGDTVWRCGTLQLARSDLKQQEMHQAIAELAFPPEWVRAVDAAQASLLAGCEVARGGAFFENGLRVRPDRLIASLLRHTGITRVSGHVTHLSHPAVQDRVAPAWQVHGADGVLAQAEVIVIANSVDAPGLLTRTAVQDPQLAVAPQATLFRQSAVAGQITLLPSSAKWRGPKVVVAGEGYVLPALEEICVTGGTYVYGADSAVPTRDGSVANVERAANLLPAIHAGNVDVFSLGGWAGWRAVVPGRLPVVGAIAGLPGVFIAGAYASRGLTWAALAGDLLAANLEGEPLMLERELLLAMGWR